PRQIGKSSLRFRAAERLAQEGVRCATIDLNLIGKGVSEQEWYQELARSLVEDLHLHDVPPGFWQETPGSPPVPRFVHFLRHHVLTRVPGPVVVFLDEIDVTRDLSFSRDDFFALIRALHDRRADNPA